MPWIDYGYRDAGLSAGDALAGPHLVLDVSLCAHGLCALRHGTDEALTDRDWLQIELNRRVV